MNLPTDGDDESELLAYIKERDRQAQQRRNRDSGAAAAIVIVLLLAGVLIAVRAG
jgi:hypothetical protein